MLSTLFILAANPATGATSAGAENLVPTSSVWVTGFLLALLWLFVAAILLGPLLTHFRLEPRSPQFFSDDRPSSTTRRR